MSMQFAIDTQPFMVNPEEVRLQQQSPAGWSYLDAIPTACRHPISTKEIIRSNGRYLGNDTVWTVSTLETESGVVVEAGWRIVDATGAKFMILDAAWSSMFCFWKLTTRNRRVVHNLRDEVAIYRGVVEAAVDSEGRRPEVTPAAVYSNLVCRVQYQDMEQGEQLGVPQLERNPQVYLEEDITVRIGDQVRITKKPDNPSLVGSILEIKAYRNFGALDVLPTLECDDNNARAA